MGLLSGYGAEGAEGHKAEQGYMPGYGLNHRRMVNLQYRPFVSEEEKTTARSKAEPKPPRYDEHGRLIPDEEPLALDPPQV